MTRFARAKGSKASNERLPEDATSWAEMKGQLQMKQKETEDEEKRNEFIAKRAENYNKFLKEQPAEKKVEWADFSDLQLMQSFKNNNKNRQNILISNEKAPAGKNKQKNKNINNNTEASEDNAKCNGASKRKIGNDESDDKNDKPNKKKAKKDKSVNGENKPTGENPEFPVNNNIENDESEDKNGKPNKKKVKKGKSVNGANKPTGENPEFPVKNNIDNDESEDKNGKPNKKKAKKDISVDGENKPTEENPEFPKKKKKNTYVLPELRPYEELSDAEKLKVDKKKARRARQQEKRKLLKQTKGENPVENQDKTEESTKDGETAKNAPNKKNGKLAKKNKKEAPKKIPYEELSEAEKLKIDRKKAKLTRQLEKRKTFKELKKIEMEQNKDENESNENGNESHEHENGDGDKNNENVNKTFNKPIKPKTPAKDKTGKEAKRKKPLPPTEQIVINGKLTDVTYMDGFPVLKEDAENLKELKQSMIKKGLPRSEIDAAMKLARRRAEKNLARKKRNVCFNCRQSGHVLSECPNLAQEENPNSVISGVCFKCGSTEHTQFQCKVVRSQEFKFATCFICKEQGHISKQCPDNAKGLYPKGGACKLCGDVTHLKKDCPKRLAEVEANTIGLDRIGDDIEGLGEEGNSVKPVTEKKRINKVVKF